MKKGKLIVLLSLFAGMALTSCLSSSDTTKQISGDASIEIKANVVGQTTTYLYAPTFYVQSTFAATKAIAYLKNDPSVSYNLTTLNAGGTLWSYVPASTEYKETKPTEGDYIFKVKFTDGDSLLTTDLLSSSI
ncbi:MAG: hypothetical protein Q8859_04820, partial [Bacteroidota bacterium]|nr:hypothetical protein [Bacteroidota bacterium]